MKKHDSKLDIIKMRIKNVLITPLEIQEQTDNSLGQITKVGVLGTFLRDSGQPQVEMYLLKQQVPLIGK